eukprot:g5983.t1
MEHVLPKTMQNVAPDLPGDWATKVRKTITLLLLSLDVIDTFLDERMTVEEKKVGVPGGLSPVKLAILRLGAWWMLSVEKGSGEPAIRVIQTVGLLTNHFYSQHAEDVKRILARFQSGAFAEFRRQQEFILSQQEFISKREPSMTHFRFNFLARSFFLGWRV